MCRVPASGLGMIRRFTWPHSAQVTLRTVCFPCPSLTRAFTPGTRRPLHPRQVKRAREGSRRTLNLSFTRLARAACSWAMAGFVWDSSTADSVRKDTRAAASSFALRDFTRQSVRGKDLLNPSRATWSTLLNLVLAESALEPVPREIWKYPAVVSDSKRRGVDASEMLLDRSFHHSAMARLKDSEKRGRPDLVHAALLSVTGTPFYLDGRVRVFVHTYPDVVLEVAMKTRIPKNYIRFRGLMEKALSERTAGELVTARPRGAVELMGEIKPDLVVGLSVRGRAVGMEELAAKLVAARNPCAVVGGFPHGHFSERLTSAFDDLARVDPRPLEAHIVTARVIYEVEKALSRIKD